MPKTKHKDGDAKRKRDHSAKKIPGRPRELDPGLDKRHQLRCKSSDFELWQRYAMETLGFPNVSAWIRHAANNALPAEMRQ